MLISWKDQRVTLVISPFPCLGFFIFKMENLDDNLSGFVQLWCIGLYGFEFQKATGPRATQIQKRMESGEKKGLSVQWNLATRGATEQLCVAPRHPTVLWQPGETDISQDYRVLQLALSLCGNHTDSPYSYLCPQHLVPCLAHSFYSINIYSTSWTEYQTSREPGRETLNGDRGQPSPVPGFLYR